MEEERHNIIVLRTNASLYRDCQDCALAYSLLNEGECNPKLSRVRVTKDITRYEFDILLCR